MVVLAKAFSSGGNGIVFIRLIVVVIL